MSASSCTFSAPAGSTNTRPEAAIVTAEAGRSLRKKPLGSRMVASPPSSL